MILDDLGTYLAESGVGILEPDTGANMFRGIMPNAPDACIAIFETPGAFPDAILESTDGAKYERPHIAVWSRGTRGDYAAARQVSQNVYDALKKIVNMTLGGKSYLQVTPLQPPFLLERDDEDRVIIAFNAEVLKRA